jgi:hypothetical protein
MRFIRTLAEFAAAAANLHPEHRSRYEELVTNADRGDPGAGAEGGQPAVTTAKSSSSSTSTSSPSTRSISTW